MKPIHREVLRLSRSLQGYRHHVTSTMTDVSDSRSRPFEEIPGPRGLCNTPVIGPAFFFKPFTNHTVEKMHKLFSELIDTYGSLVRVKLDQWTVLVEDAADVQVVMKNEGRYPGRKVHYIHQHICQQNGVKEGLLLLQGEDWYQLRSVLNRRMARVSCAQDFLPVQNEVADDLVTRLKEDKPTPEEMFEMIFRYSCESISVVIFNKRLGYLRPDILSHPDKLKALQDFRDMFRLQNQTLYTHPFILRNFPLKAKKEYQGVLDRIAKQAHGHYQSSLLELQRKKEEGTLHLEENNLLLSLMSSEKLSLEDMGALAMDVFSGGTDSTARAIQMLLYVLARNPEKQEKLHKEIINHLGPDRPLTVQGLKNLSYMSACIKESFRLFHPVLCGTQRYLPNDIILQGYRIPAGTSIVLMSQKTAMNKKYFPDPEIYQPERWLRDEDGNRTNTIPLSALTPFGVGTRQCVGKRFAEQEIALAVTKILQNFEVSLEPDHEEVDVLYQIFIATKDPIKFVLGDRKRLV